MRRRSKIPGSEVFTVKKAIVLAAMLALVATSCGLKVPATIVAGNNPELGDNGVYDPGDGTGPAGPIPGGPSGPTGPDVPGGTGPTGPTGPTDPGENVTGSKLFDLETEGVTKETIRICAHVPITGAAPIPHAPERFGQFYFDAVNAEQGGVYGRRVTFDAINDNYNPAGARSAMDQCARRGAFIYAGAAGTDQIVSVARWAERERVPYLHGPTSIKDLGNSNYNIHAGPSYEFQHELLADYLVSRPNGKNEKYITVKVDSPYFDAGADAFRARMKHHGIDMPPDIRVQKDERQFTSVIRELRDKGITVVNNFTTPSIWIPMLQQKGTYNPLWTAVSPVAGFNIVAQALTGIGQAVVFHHFGPACECATYDEAEISQKTHLPWYEDIREFLRIFKKYSKEQDPPPDDFDYASYLSAKALHRLLLKVGPEPTRTKLWEVIRSYKESPAKTFPGCAADFSRNENRMGAWRVNVFELQMQRGAGVWKQIKTCIDRA